MTRLRCLRQLRGGRLQIAALIVGTALLLASSTVGGQAATGRLTGTVKLTLANSTPSAATAYERRSVSPRPKAMPELRSVVIFFTDVAATKSAAMSGSIAQKDEQFVPHLVAVTAGSAVAFPNQDPFFHNVFSLSRGASFNLGRYPSGASRSRVVTRPGVIKVFCEIHSHMSAVIRVFDHPWFTVPSDAGTFTIDNVPVGDHVVAAWHERIGERRDKVTIRAGAATQVNFTLPVLEPAP